MTEGAGVVRSADSLAAAGTAVGAIDAEVGGATPPDRSHGELANLITAARSLLSSATVRCETRGAHARSDHPEPSDRWRRRIVHIGGEVVLFPLEPGTPEPASQAFER
jgi:L-aspartate oxidase